ncbi:uncharacterized protein BBA_03775 [Beauveria bassiana ARSEF 2860]|uniref:Uncharacterized protein n=1 Tax=Beauveria bassiana (strain ARSEF 2860) TaxID=655819 RepID=J5JYC1_BEAB2|nr:uncharacterized protein BBA_03775 [Beauveria bassiana ARSEF 2860]EJP67201.1 hypothetical protein BBA_03775 [Beauveria bassiana ARSEF 2860]
MVYLSSSRLSDERQRHVETNPDCWLVRLPGDPASDGGKTADFYVGNGLYILTANAAEFARQSDKATEEAGWIWSYIMYE